MGQCTSKTADERSSSSSHHHNNIDQSDSDSERPQSVGGGKMSPEEATARRPVVQKRRESDDKRENFKKKKSSSKVLRNKCDDLQNEAKTVSAGGDANEYQNGQEKATLAKRPSFQKRRESVENGQVKKKNSLNKLGRKPSGTKLGNNNSLTEKNNAANSYEYCDPNASFLVHDVVKRGGCETFVIDFVGEEGGEKPKRKKPNLPMRQAPSPSVPPSPTPSPNIKSKNGANSKVSKVKQEKENSNKAIKSKSNNAKPSPVTKGQKQIENKQKEGRIHSAVVSGINLDSRSVTVEWFERGETKGKEIELDAILILNQDLAPQNENSNLIPNKLTKYVPRPSVVTSQQNNRAAAVSSAAIAPPSRGSVSSGGQAALGRTRNNKATRPTMNGAEISQHAQLQQQQLQQQQIQQQQQKYQQQQAAAAAAAAASEAQMDDGQNGMDGGSGKQGAGCKSIPGGRRSNVVKQVERLKKNREERRAKQAEILEEKTAQKDPGNPNWEFLSMIKEYQEQLEFNPLQEGDAIIDHQITVCVRKRPLNKKEKQKKEVDVVTIPNKDQTIVHEPKTKVDLTKYLDNQHFRFDYAFDETCSNELVYKYSARPLVQNIFEGGMATCFAYGQTGSGKTHTMGGEFHGKTQDSKNGIYALATKDVFKFLNLPKYKPMKLQVSCSYFEIYSGKVFDLLSGKSKLRVLEDGKQQVVVVGLVEKTVESVDDVLKLINLGNNVRTSGQTSANAHSSRSHAVFQIILRQGAKKSVYGKFSLIDLAGNERGADTSSANRQTRMEGAEINKSLLALKECIRALGRKGAHLPFRASKLTQVLRDSFIGEKSKTCMIAMVSPGLSSCEHSLNTLRYADRVKELGAEDPALQKASPTENGHEDDMRLDDGVMSPEDSDLAQLRSLNEGELSADWYNFQEAVTHLQALEEDLVDAHRSVIVNMQQWASDDAMLLAMTNEVDYDQDAYCQQLEEMIADKIEAFSNLREKARYFRECLNDEESKSRLLVRRN